jgi:hypothetical protein
MVMFVLPLQFFILELISLIPYKYIIALGIHFMRNRHHEHQLS